MKVEWADTAALKVIAQDEGVPSARQARAGQSAAAQVPLPNFLTQAEAREALEFVEARRYEIQPDTLKRNAAAPTINAALRVEDGADYIMLVREPSGALRFHDGKEDGTRRVSSGGLSRKSRPKTYAIRFSAPVALAANVAQRRGLIGKIVNKVVDVFILKVVDFIAETAVDGAEWAIWKLLGRKPGLYQLSANPAGGFSMKPAKKVIKAGPFGNALLFLHGTFSTTQGSFGDLAAPAFFDQLTERYGEAIYGFDHFSVSQSPERNARDLLAALQKDGPAFDVVTHSRGGLVLRNLVERRSALANSDRFRLGNAALVACPNEGTPLATPGRWKDTAGWLANVLDVFPPNPVTSNAAMVLRWLVWFTKVGVRAAEGLDAMNQGGDFVRELQLPPSPMTGQYSALVSNFEPDQKLWARALDLGIDWFFNGANDLVVPTSGGWRVDQLPGLIPIDQIGAYGPGGNIETLNGQVSHVSFFDKMETQRFIINALRGQSQGLPPIEVAKALPVGRRAAMAWAKGPSPAQITISAPAGPTEKTRSSGRERQDPTPKFSLAAQPRGSVFELVVLDPEQVQQLGLPTGSKPEDSTPLLYAAYGGARVVVPFRYKKAHIAHTGDEAIDRQVKAMHDAMHKRWGGLFGFHKQVRAYLDAEPGAQELSNEQLIALGDLLFDTLFPEDVRRLFDVARVTERDKLFVIFTSMIPWVFDMPWEFARDSVRGTFLATEDVHFIRNVLTPTPVEQLPRSTKLKVLIASAEPYDLGRLSVAEETAKLQNALQEINDHGLITVDTLPRATPHSLHRAIAVGGYQVVHFIGHGFWSEDESTSGLVLENPDGSSRDLGGRALCDVLSGRGIRLIFLNACDTGRGRRQSGSQEAASTGVAQDLFSRGVPNVIANQFPVGDRAAVAFARTVYEFLAQGLTFAQAIREARIAANYEKGGETMDWAIPVAYARDPDDRLVDVDGMGD